MNEAARLKEALSGTARNPFVLLNDLAALAAEAEAVLLAAEIAVVNMPITGLSDDQSSCLDEGQKLVAASSRLLDLLRGRLETLAGDVFRQGAGHG